jgi:hypothetical protein
MVESYYSVQVSAQRQIIESSVFHKVMANANSDSVLTKMACKDKPNGSIRLVR